MLMKPCVLPILNMANAHSPLALSLPSWRGLLSWALFLQQPYCPERLNKLHFTTLDLVVKTWEQGKTGKTKITLVSRDEMAAL